MAERKKFEPKAWHKKVAEKVVEQKEGFGYIIVDGDVYETDRSRDDFKAYMKEKTKKRLLKKREREKAMMKKKEARLAKQALKRAEKKAKIESRAKALLKKADSI